MTDPVAEFEQDYEDTSFDQGHDTTLDQDFQLAVVRLLGRVAESTERIAVALETMLEGEQ